MIGGHVVNARFRVRRGGIAYWGAVSVLTGAIMWPGISFHLAQLLPDVQLSIYPDSSHGGIFQHHDLFVAQALEFLRD
jgi:pimeloyl-ACP methyl ester carboxylesterase